MQSGLGRNGLMKEQKKKTSPSTPATKERRIPSRRNRGAGGDLEIALPWAPEFRATAVGGKYGSGCEVSLADFRGAPLVLYFFTRKTIRRDARHKRVVYAMPGASLMETPKSSA